RQLDGGATPAPRRARRRRSPVAGESAGRRGAAPPRGAPKTEPLGAEQPPLLVQRWLQGVRAVTGPAHFLARLRQHLSRIQRGEQRLASLGARILPANDGDAAALRIVLAGEHELLPAGAVLGNEATGQIVHREALANDDDRGVRRIVEAT